MLPSNIESEMKEILEKIGTQGWLRVNEAAKLYAKKDNSRRTKFFRWRKQVEKGRVDGFKVLVLIGNVAYIGLKNANPDTIVDSIAENRKLERSVSSRFNFLSSFQQRKERRKRESACAVAIQRRRMELIDELDENDPELMKKLNDNELDLKRKYGLL